MRAAQDLRGADVPAWSRICQVSRLAASLSRCRAARAITCCLLRSWHSQRCFQVTEADCRSQRMPARLRGRCCCGLGLVHVRCEPVRGFPALPVPVRAGCLQQPPARGLLHHVFDPEAGQNGAGTRVLCRWTMLAPHILRLWPRPERRSGVGVFVVWIRRGVWAVTSAGPTGIGHNHTL